MTPTTTTTDDEGVESVVRRVGDRIAELRRRKGLTQRELAHLVPMNFAQFRHLEQGRRDIFVGTLFRVACALDVPVSALFRKPRAPRPRSRSARSTKP